MRLLVYLGRGGRGHPTLPKPKYLIGNDKRIYDLKVEKLKNNQFSVLDQPDVQFELKDTNDVWLDTNGRKGIKIQEKQKIKDKSQ